MVAQEIAHLLRRLEDEDACHTGMLGRYGTRAGRVRYENRMSGHRVEAVTVVRALVLPAASVAPTV